MAGALRKMRRRLRAVSRRAAAGFSALLVTSLVLLVLARLTFDTFSSQVLIDLGSGFLILALGYVFLDPLFEQARRGSVEERPYFDHELFSQQVALARRTVEILETWTGLLEDRHRPDFLTALRVACEAGVDIRILLLDPDSAAAVQRAEELAPLDVRQLIRSNLQHLHALIRQHPGIAVRVYDASVSESLYRWDDRAMIARLPRDEPAYNTTQHEALATHPWAASALERFEELWRHESTRPLAAHMLLPVTVLLDEQPLSRHELPYVNGHLDGHVIDGRELIAELTDHGAPRLMVEILDGQRPPTRYRLSRADEDGAPVGTGITEAFDRKYGPATGRNPLRLIPMLPAPD